MIMGNAVQQFEIGDSIPFSFDRGGKSLDGFVCTINLRVYPGDSTLVSRAITAVGTKWPGFLTATETASLSVGDYRLSAKFVKAATDELESSSQDRRFRLSVAYVD